MQETSKLWDVYLYMQMLSRIRFSGWQPNFIVLEVAPVLVILSVLPSLIIPPCREMLSLMDFWSAQIHTLFLSQPVQNHTQSWIHCTISRSKKKQPHWFLGSASTFKEAVRLLFLLRLMVLSAAVSMHIFRMYQFSLGKLSVLCGLLSSWRVSTIQKQSIWAELCSICTESWTGCLPFLEKNSGMITHTFALTM